MLPRLSMLLSVLLASSLHAENWPGWRGPTGVGVSAEKDLPLTWGGKTDENILWKTPLEGVGNSSPIVWGDRVFVTTSAKQTRQEQEQKLVPAHHVVCLAAADGKVIWKTPIPPGQHPEGYDIYAVPTPVTDGQRVYAWFSSGVFAAVDFDGKIVWRTERAGPFNLNPGLCSSPVLYKDTVILLVDQARNLGYLQALDAKTGEVKWEQKRPKQSYTNTSPVLIRIGERDELIIAASNAVQGLDPANGNTLWFATARGFGASPAFGNGLLYVDTGTNDSPAQAIQPGGEGDVTKSRVKWTVPKVKAEYASPVVSGDYVYRTHKPGIVTCRSLITGEEVFSERLDGVSILSSPIVTADGRVYIASPDKSYVLKSGPKLEVLATNAIKGGGNTGASPAVANGRIYLRDKEAVYGIGKK